MGQLAGCSCYCIWVCLLLKYASECVSQDFFHYGCHILELVSKAQNAPFAKVQNFEDGPCSGSDKLAYHLSISIGPEISKRSTSTKKQENEAGYLRFCWFLKIWENLRGKNWERDMCTTHKCFYLLLTSIYTDKRPWTLDSSACPDNCTIPKLLFKLLSDAKLTSQFDYQESKIVLTFHCHNSETTIFM